MAFERYQSKPVTRLAHEITEHDLITEQSPNRYRLKMPEGDAVDFVAFCGIKTGDFVVFHNEDDIYHCNRKVFAERNQGVEV